MTVELRARDRAGNIYATSILPDDGWEQVAALWMSAAPPSLEVVSVPAVRYSAESSSGLSLLSSAELERAGTDTPDRRYAA